MGAKEVGEQTEGGNVKGGRAWSRASVGGERGGACRGKAEVQDVGRVKKR